MLPVASKTHIFICSAVAKDEESDGGMCPKIQYWDYCCFTKIFLCVVAILIDIFRFHLHCKLIFVAYNLTSLLDILSDVFLYIALSIYNMHIWLKKMVKLKL